MKQIKSILMAGLVALVTVASASAQQYGVISTIAGGGTYIAPASAATNIAGVVTATKYEEVALAITFKLMGAGTGAIDLAWSTSADGVNYSTTVGNGAGWFTACAGNGTTVVTCTTNIPLGSLGYWKLNWLTNGSASVITNLSITAYGKPKRNG